MRTATRDAKGVRPGMLKNVRDWTPPPPKKDIYITKEIIKKGRKKPELTATNDFKNVDFEMIWSTLSKPESYYVDGCLCVWLGLIIDAFGELRDQLEQVKEDMEVSILHPTPLPNFTSHPPPQFYTTPRQFYTTPPSPILHHTPSPILHHTPLPNFTPHPLPNFTSYPLPNFTSHPLPNFTPHPPPQFYTTSLRNFTSHPPPQFYTPFPNFTIPPPQYYTTPPPQFYTTPPSPYNSTPPCAITLLLLFSFPVQQLLSRWKHLSTCFIFLLLASFCPVSWQKFADTDLQVTDHLQNKNCWGQELFDLILYVDQCSFRRNGGHTYGHWDCLCSLWIFSSSSVHSICILRKKAHMCFTPSQKFPLTSLVFNPLRCKCFKLTGLILSILKWYWSALFKCH